LLIFSQKDSPSKRLNALVSELIRKDIDWAVISTPKHVYYCTGFWTYRPEFTSLIVVNKQGESTLFVGESEKPNASATFSGSIMSFEDYNLQKRMVADPSFVCEEFGKMLKKLVPNSLGSTSFGYEETHLPVLYAKKIMSTMGKNLKLVGISNILLQLRKTKGTDEKNYIRNAAKRLDLAHKVAKDFCKPAVSELDLLREINSQVLAKYGVSQLWETADVLGDIVSGRRALETGGPPTKKKLKLGENVTLDLQTQSHRYWADTTRTFVVGKKITKDQQKAFKTLLRAMTEAEKILRPGTRAKDVFLTVNGVITSAGFKPMPHHAGHGIGLDAQEAPFLILSEEEELAEGMACAVEVGIYENASGGMRIEDNYIITKDGFERISNFPLTMA
jgi:Xaa-Pro dipeptidase